MANSGVNMIEVPSWEKEFVHKIGLFKWDDFLKAKENTKYGYKVLEWNDSAAEKALHRAKYHFFVEIHGLPCSDLYIADPDLYIDEIHWDDDFEENDDSSDEEEEEEFDDFSDEDEGTCYCGISESVLHDEWDNVMICLDNFTRARLEYWR